MSVRKVRNTPAFSASIAHRAVYLDSLELRAAINEIIDDLNAGTYGGDMTKAVYDADLDSVVDNSEKLGGLTSGQFIRSDASDSVDAAVVTTHHGAILATDLNASANVAANWLEVSDGSTDAGTGIDIYDEWAAGTKANIRRIKNNSGFLEFSKLSGDDATGYQYSFDGTISGTDLILSASITDPSGYSVSSPPTQAEVNAILTTVKDIYNALK